MTGFRDAADKTRLSYWFPLVEAAGIPVPRTVIIRTDCELIRVLDGETPDGFNDLVGTIRSVSDIVGVPFFLRTDFTSAKHGWKNTCHVTDADLIPHHIADIVEYSQCVDLIGLPCDKWAVREMLHVEPLFEAFRGAMPITREFRFFVRDGHIESYQPYWPVAALADDTDSDGWRDKIYNASRLSSDELATLTELTLKVSAAVPGFWSVDWLETTDRGWILTDMAEGDHSFHWTPSPMEKILFELSEFYSVEDSITWLHSPHKLLTGAIPYDLLGTDRADEVYALIDGLRSGAYQ